MLLCIVTFWFMYVGKIPGLELMPNDPTLRKCHTQPEHYMMSGASPRADCYVKAVYNIGKVDLCRDRFVIENLKPRLASCIALVARRTKDESLCNRIEIENNIIMSQREKCLHSVAVAKKDVKLCKKINTRYAGQNICIEDVARAVGSPKLCEAIEHDRGDFTKEHCRRISLEGSCRFIDSSGLIDEELERECIARKNL